MRFASQERLAGEAEASSLEGRGEQEAIPKGPPPAARIVNGYAAIAGFRDAHKMPAVSDGIGTERDNEQNHDRGKAEFCELRHRWIRAVAQALAETYEPAGGEEVHPRRDDISRAQQCVADSKAGAEQGHQINHDNAADERRNSP